MFLACWFRRRFVPALLVSALGVSIALAEEPAKAPATPVSTSGSKNVQPMRVADRSEKTTITNIAPLGPGRADEHPLMPALRWAKEGLPAVEEIRDYSATMVKRERVNGELLDHEYMFVKIRHKPFSAYLYFLGPAKLKGQESIYVEGKNNGKLWGHGTGMEKTLFGTLSLDPTGMIAMRGNRYPITEIGVLNLVRRLVEVAEKDVQYGECEVKFLKNAKINGRTCTCIEVTHPTPRSNFRFHLARIFVDDELNMPLRYESHDWPKNPGEKPELIEEYTYLNFKFNNGFTDSDFDTKNSNYNFP